MTDAARYTERQIKKYMLYRNEQIKENGKSSVAKNPQNRGCDDSIEPMNPILKSDFTSTKTKTRLWRCCE